MITRRAMLAGAAGAVGLAAANLGISEAVATDEAISDKRSRGGTRKVPRLHVRGNWMVDECGRKVTLRGFAGPIVGRAYTAEQYNEILDLALLPGSGWYASLVRLGVYPKFWREQPDYVEKQLRPAVERCIERGVYCAIDWHELPKPPFQGNDDDGYPILEQTEEFWTEVAPLWAGVPNVLYEIFNEPNSYLYGLSDPEGEWRYLKPYEQSWVDLVRRYSDNLILAPTPLFRYPGLVVDDQLEGDDIAYTFHVYPGLPAEPESYEERLGRACDNLAMVATEWGFALGAPNPVGGTASEFGDPWRAWVDTRANLGWTAFKFDCLSDYFWSAPDGDRTRISEWTLLGGDDHMGEFTKQWLFDRRHDNAPIVWRGSGN